MSKARRRLHKVTALHQARENRRAALALSSNDEPRLDAKIQRDRRIVQATFTASPAALGTDLVQIGIRERSLLCLLWRPAALPARMDITREELDGLFGDDEGSTTPAPARLAAIGGRYGLDSTGAWDALNASCARGALYVDGEVLQ